MKTKNIPLNKLHESPLNTYPTDDIEEVKVSIEESGLIEALTVYKESDDSYEILSGARRFKALCELQDEGFTVKNLKYDAIPCMVIEEKLEDDEKELVIEKANVVSRESDGRPAHRLRICELLTQIYTRQGRLDELNNSVFAEYMKVSTQWASIYNAINKSNELLKNALGQNKVSVEDAGFLAKNFDEKGIKDILKRIDNDENIKDIIADAKKSIKARKDQALINNDKGINQEDFEKFKQNIDRDGYVDKSAEDKYLDRVYEDDIDIPDSDFFDDAKATVGDLNIDIDTTGELRGLTADNAEERKQKTIKTVKTWAKRMHDKKQNALTEEEIETITYVLDQLRDFNFQ